MYHVFAQLIAEPLGKNQLTQFLCKPYIQLGNQI